MKKIFLFLALGTFLVSGICLAAGVDPSKIVIPTDSGRIVEVYKADNPNAPLIVYLQDIHVNYEAQKAEADVLVSLIKNNGVDLVFVEGRTGGNTEDLKELRAKGTKEARDVAADKLLKEGTIGAADYLDLTTDLSFVISGAEDMKAYKKARVDHLAIYEKGQDMTKLVATLQNIASNLKLHIYSKEMRDLDDKAASYNKDEIGLVEYVKFLSGAAAANNIDLKTYPNVSLFADSSNLEGQIDFVAVEKERTAAVDAVEKALTDPKAKEEFTAKGLKFRTGDVTQGEYYTYIKDTAAAAKVDLSASKNLNTYTQYITTYEKIDQNLLFKELDQAVDIIKTALLKTPEEQQLNKIDKGLAILSDMINTKLVPDEYAHYQNNKADFDANAWLQFLKNNSTKFALTNPVPDDVKPISDNIALIEKFYTESIDRDNAFIANIKATMASLKKDSAVFNCGGFHTPNVKRLLKENGFSYVIIAPRVDVVKNYEDVYKAKIKNDMEYLNKEVPETPAEGGEKK